MSQILEIYTSGFFAWLGITIGMIIVGSTVVGMLKYTLNYTFRCWNRFLRHRNIKAHGWPSSHLMDADGDIVHPKPAQQS
tara:strand:- start:910 stop:1149 length:240 start_codon:yes stop_codon:yes gene_type:complete